MSKETEFLKKLRYASLLENDLRKELEELLAQPEQEPVAWMSLSDIEWMNIVNSPKILELTDGRHNSEEAVNLAVKMTEEKCKKNNSDSIPKREPLSEEEVFDIGYKSGFAVDQDESADYESDAYGFLNEDGYVDNELYFKLVRAIEKAHGIGGE